MYPRRAFAPISCAAASPETDGAEAERTRTCHEPFVSRCEVTTRAPTSDAHLSIDTARRLASCLRLRTLAPQGHSGEEGEVGEEGGADGGGDGDADGGGGEGGGGTSAVGTHAVPVQVQHAVHQG